MPGPSDGQPDTSVNPGGDFQLAQSFDLLIDRVESLTNVIKGQTSVMERTASAEARYKAAGLQQPQISDVALARVRAAGGASLSGLTGGTTQITSYGALSSVANLQSFAAQRLGSWLYGTGLFTQPGGGGGGAAAPPSSTPTGTPNSTAAPAGAGALAAAAAGAAVSGGAGYGGGGSGGGAAPPAGPAAPGGPGGGIGGLPGVIWPQGPQNALQQRGQAAMRLLGARIALSGGTSGGLLSALKDIPGLGLVVDAYNKGFSTFQGAIYDPGRRYQEIEGGSALGGNQFERLHQAAYQASNLFTPMGAQAAGEAFNAVTALGYNRAAQGEAVFGGTGPYGQNRQGALNFIYHQYTATGAPIDQSVQVLETASQNATIALGNVSQALVGLSNDAGKAGTNAQQARMAFQQYFQVAVGQGAAQGAPALAGAVAATQAAYGKQFAGVSFAGELGAARQYLLAGQYGITPGQAQFLQRTQPGQYASMLAGQNLNFIQEYLGIPSADIGMLQQMVQQAGGASAVKLNPDLADQIGQRWLNTDPWAMNNANLNIWAMELAQLTGIQLTAGNVMTWIVQQVAGNNEAANQVAPGSTQTSPAAGRTVGAGTAAAGRGSVRYGQYGLAQQQNATPLYGRAGALGMTTGALSWQQVLTSHSGTAAQAYLSEEKRSGSRSPVLEALLQNLNQTDMVQVQTSTGPRVMSLTDAMRYYPDELMAGNVMFFNAAGTKSFGNTAQVTRGLTQANTGAAAEERQSAGSHLGVSQAAWQKSHPGAYASASTGKGVTVTLSKEAQQLLKLLPSNSDTASAMGTAPSPPWPSISSR